MHKLRTCGKDSGACGKLRRHNVAVFLGERNETLNRCHALLFRDSHADVHALVGSPDTEGHVGTVLVLFIGAKFHAGPENHAKSLEIILI